MMQVEERHYYYYWRECECVWVDVWPRSLASSPAPHATHSLRTNVYQDRKTIKGRFYYELHRRHLQKPEQKKKSGFRSYWEFVSCLHAGNFLTTHKTVEIRTPEALPAHAVIAYAMLFISLCSSPHRVDICEHEPSVREFAHVLTASKG